MRTHALIRVACLSLALPALLLSACTSTARRDPVRDTYVDPDASVSIIDVAVAKPRIAARNEAVLAPAMREAARRLLLDEKGYSVVADPVVDEAMATAGLDASIDASVAANVVDADCVILIHVTSWNAEELIPRGHVFASGTIRAAGRPNGRRVYEHTFTNERLLAPGEVNPLNRDEAEAQLAADLVNRALASFRRKN